MLNCIDIDKSVTVVKNFNKEYDNRDVHLYKLLAENTFEYLGESKVVYGTATFNVKPSLDEDKKEILTTEYFVSDIKIEESQNVDTDDIIDLKGGLGLLM